MASKIILKDAYTSLELTKSGVWIVSMLGKNKNQFDLNFSVSLYESLTHVKNHCKAGEVMVLQSKDKKFFSNGLDLEFVQEIRSGTDTAGLDLFGRRVMPCFGLTTEIKIPTVALVNAHSIGAGVMLSIGCDYILGNSENKGMYWAPEVTYGMVIPPPEIELFKYSLDYKTFQKLVLEGHKFKPQECLEAGIFDKLVPQAEMETLGIEFALSKQNLSNEAYFLAKDQAKGHIARYIHEWCYIGLGLETETTVDSLKPHVRFSRL